MLLSLATTAFSQAVPNIITLLGDTLELSSLLSAASSFPELVTALGAAKSLTILASDNGAFMAFNAMSQAQNTSRDALSALLSYHVLIGSFPSTMFSEKPAFSRIAWVRSGVSRH